jgi:hypothetical protein
VRALAPTGASASGESEDAKSGRGGEGLRVLEGEALPNAGGGCGSAGGEAEAAEGDDDTDPSSDPKKLLNTPLSTSDMAKEPWLWETLAETASLCDSELEHRTGATEPHGGVEERGHVDMRCRHPIGGRPGVNKVGLRLQRGGVGGRAEDIGGEGVAFASNCPLASDVAAEAQAP